MADFKDYYEILRVTKNATPKDVKDSYRKLAKKFHQDAEGGKSKKAQAKMQEINEAYEVLSDEDKRKLYDSLGRQGIEGTLKGAKSTTNEWGSIFPKGWFDQEWVPDATEWNQTPLCPT